MKIEFWWILGVFTISGHVMTCLCFETVPRPLRPGIHLHQSRSSIATSHSAMRFFAALLTRITRIMKSAGHMLINFVQNYNLAGKNDDQSWDLGAAYMFKQTQNCFDHHSEPAKPLRKEKKSSCHVVWSPKLPATREFVRPRSKSCNCSNCRCCKNLVCCSRILANIAGSQAGQTKAFSLLTNSNPAHSRNVMWQTQIINHPQSKTRHGAWSSRVSVYPTIFTIPPNVQQCIWQLDT